VLNPLFWGEKGGGVSPMTGIVKILETVLLSVVATVGYVQLKYDAALEMRILVTSQVGYGDLMASVKTDEFPKSRTLQSSQSHGLSSNLLKEKSSNEK